MRGKNSHGKGWEKRKGIEALSILATLNCTVSILGVKRRILMIEHFLNAK